MSDQQQTLDGSTVAQDMGRIGGSDLSGLVLEAAPPNATWGQLVRWYRLAVDAGLLERYGADALPHRSKRVKALIRDDIREHGRYADREGDDG